MVILLSSQKQKEHVHEESSISLKVEDVMVREVITLDENSTVKEAAEVMNKFEIGCILAVGKGKAMAARLLDNGLGILQRVSAEELPLRGAQPEHGLSALVDEVAVVLADLDGQGRRLGRCDRPDGEQRQQQ